MRYADLDMCQINDGLNQTASCGNAVTYDKRSGLVFVSYLTGYPMHYGESYGILCLSIFPASQPHNVRHRTVEIGAGKTWGVLCNSIYVIGNRKVRMIYSSSRGVGENDLDTVKGTFYKDYDFETDTFTERQPIYLRTDNGDQLLNSTLYTEYMTARGYRVRDEWEAFVNKVTAYNGELYTSVMVNDWDGGHPLLCKIENDVLVPFATFPERCTYEFRYFVNDEGIFAVYRVYPDDHGTGHGGYAVSRDGGATWEISVFEDGVQSRPDILEYYGKPLVIYNYKSDRSVENFPLMHNSRNSIKFVYDGKVVLDLFSKYGFVEHETVSIAGDLYMVFSNAPKALSTENSKAWSEDGHVVEQGKEATQWAYIGYLADR